MIYSLYFGLIVSYYGLPIHIIRDLYLTFRSFVVRINDIIRYRQATSDMENKYPTVTAEELAASIDKVCIICREEMEIGPDGPKKLPCGHFFHKRCLRSWLERQQACPTCRKSVIQPRPQNPYPAYPGNMANVVHNMPNVQNVQQPPGTGGPAQPTPTFDGRTVHLSAEQPVSYDNPENILHIGGNHYLLRDRDNNPVYLERVNVPESTSSMILSQELESLDDQIAALTKVRSEIDALLEKARTLQKVIVKQNEPENSDPNL